MRRSPPLARLSVLIALGLFQATVRAEAPEPDGAADPARVKALRDQAGSLRNGAEARYADEHIACYKTFLVNRCIDQAKQRRLAEVKKARELDLDADRSELSEKNRRYAARQAEREEEAAKQAVARAAEEARARADNEARLQRFANDDAARVRRDQEGKANAMREAEARSRKEAEQARRRAEEASAASARAEKANQDRADYAEREREHARKMEEKAAKKKADGGKPASGLSGF